LCFQGYDEWAPVVVCRFNVKNSNEVRTILISITLTKEASEAEKNIFLWTLEMKRHVESGKSIDI
jgi:hypothetical protein